jgi:uncharacterized protein with von Willebrand factor type A (vWA) domain
VPDLQPADSHPPELQRPDEVLLGFCGALRAAGVAVTHDRAMTFLRAASVVGLAHEPNVYWAGRATLCAGPDDLSVYDALFAEWFRPLDLPVVQARRTSVVVRQAPLGQADDDVVAAHDETPDPVHASASAAEVLRHRDIADLSAAERARLVALFATVVPRWPRRRTSRREPWHRGDLDPRETLRRSLRTCGEPMELARRRRRTRARRVVLLLDVSGSMSPYADALLRLAHRFVHGGPANPAGPRSTRSLPVGPVEVFTLGTRVTQVTRLLRPADAERALAAAGEAVPDWSGGTRLGDTLKVFLDRWGQRGLARGAVVVVISDGWERGDAELLGEQMARLGRLAHRVVWMNPHRGRAGFQPVQHGMAAALPHVDDFIAGHSLAAFAHLTDVVAHA